MIGSLPKEAFQPERNYNDFYANHAFEPLPEPLCYEADTVMPRVGWAVAVAEEIKAKRVLDLCCLDGFASLTIATQLGIECHGVDLSEPGVELANERAEKNRLLAVFAAEAIEDMQETETKYDLVLLFEAIEHFKDVDKVMEVIKQQLAPGGTLLVSTPDAEGFYGIGNDDACHLQIYTHRESPPYPFDPTWNHKPILSLPNYLRANGFKVVANDVWNELIHIRAVLA